MCSANRSLESFLLRYGLRATQLSTAHLLDDGTPTRRAAQLLMHASQRTSSSRKPHPSRCSSWSLAAEQNKNAVGP